MIPGLSGMTAGLSDGDGTAKLKRMIYIYDSMTVKELESDGKILLSEPSRMTRIAKGSGTSVREVEELLTQHKVMAGIAKNMGANKANMQRAQKMMQGPNSKQQQAAFQKRMQSMGGAGRGGGGGGMADMMRMAQQMGGGGGMPGGGMPDMSQLQSMMSQMGGMGGLANMFGGGGAGGSSAGRGGRR